MQNYARLFMSATFSALKVVNDLQLLIIFTKSSEGLSSMLHWTLNASTPPFEETLLHLFSCFYFIDSRLALFEELYKVDRELTILQCNLLATLLVKSRFHKQQTAATLKNAAITGSTYEGALVARMFKSVNGNAAREFEADIEFLVAELPISCKNIVEDIPDKTGFAKVRMTRGLLQKVLAQSGWNVSARLVQVICSGFSENGILSYIFLKKYFGRKFQRNLIADTCCMRWSLYFRPRQGKMQSYY